MGDTAKDWNALQELVRPSLRLAPRYATEPMLLSAARDEMVETMHRLKACVHQNAERIRDVSAGPKFLPQILSRHSLTQASSTLLPSPHFYSQEQVDIDVADCRLPTIREEIEQTLRASGPPRVGPLTALGDALPWTHTGGRPEPSGPAFHDDPHQARDAEDAGPSSNDQATQSLGAGAGPSREPPPTWTFKRSLMFLTDPLRGAGALPPPPVATMATESVGAIVRPPSESLGCGPLPGRSEDGEALGALVPPPPEIAASEGEEGGSEADAGLSAAQRKRKKKEAQRRVDEEDRKRLRAALQVCMLKSKNN